MAKLYPRSRLVQVATQTGFTEAYIIQILEDQRDDLDAIRDWVIANEGTTDTDALANAWLPGSAPVNAADVLSLAVALRIIVSVEETP